MIVRAFAPAKVNLFLHVGPPRPGDGRHPLSSLVAFADVGDQIEVQSAPGLTLEVTGPFAGQLASESDNLVLRAARLLAAHFDIPADARIVLDKHLPIASGIGGGSSDAAATLRALNKLWNTGADLELLEQLAGPLGADVPVCVRAQTAWMEGTGEQVCPAALPPLPCVLVNPGMPAPTGAVYRAYDGLGRFGQVDAQWTWSPDEDPNEEQEGQLDVLALLNLLNRLDSTRNDLTQAAIVVCPPIGQVLAELEELDAGLLSRLSGSGATCFALFAQPAQAAAAAARLQEDHPDWWCRATMLAASNQP